MANAEIFVLEVVQALKDHVKCLLQGVQFQRLDGNSLNRQTARLRLCIAAIVGWGIHDLHAHNNYWWAGPTLAGGDVDDTGCGSLTTRRES